MVRLMDLLFFVFLVTAVFAKFPEIEDGDSDVVAAIKSVYQTWDPKKNVTIRDDLWNVGDDKKSRKKRQVDFNLYCPEGYTGEDCEFPICDNINFEAINDPSGGLGEKVLIDTAFYSSCDISMPTLIDSELRGIYITVTTNPTESPEVHLVDSNGNEVRGVQLVKSEWRFGQQPAGLYYTRISEPSLECFVVIQGSSSLRIDGGFVPFSDTENVASDRNDYPTATAYLLQPSTFVVHAYGLQRPGQIVSVTMFQGYNSVARPQMLLKRYGCAYEYFVETFFCRSKLSSHFFRVEGIDFSGNRFRRYKSFSCYEPPPTSAPVPTTPRPGPRGCRNFGKLMYNSDNTTYCYCASGFTGIDCGSNICYNGGTRFNGIVCACPTGFTGNHCENVICPDKADRSFLTDRPQMIFVIRANLAIKSVVDQVATQIRAIAEQVQFDPGYLQHFAVLTFRGSVLLDGWQKHYGSAEAIIAALQNISYADTTDCADGVLKAIAEAINALAFTYHSPVYVITDAVPNDEAEAETIFHLNTYRNLPIYVIYLEQPPESGCTLDVYHTGYQALVDITHRTSGHTFIVPYSSTNQTGQLFYSHALHTIYRSSLILSTDSALCYNRPKFVPVRVDRNTKTIVITATGQDLELVFTPPNDIHPSNVAAYSLGNIKFWWFDNLAIGTWGISVRSSNPNSGSCSVRIYSTRISSKERTEYDLFWAFTDQLTNDGPFLQPIFAEQNSLVAHINNYVVHDPSKVFAELIFYRELDDGTQEQVYLSNGIWRDECSYQLYFPPLVCHVANELLYFSVYVRDELGFTFQRSGVSYCSSAHPTISPPSECANGGASLVLPNNKTICYCTADWTGVKCEIPVCHNGGTLDRNGKCACIAGFDGQHCEKIYCTEHGDIPQPTINRDMAFVIELSMNTVSGVIDLGNYIAGIVRDMALHHNEWIANFYLTTYDGSSPGYYLRGIYRRYQIDRFVRDVRALQNDPSISVDSCNTTVHVWEALEETVSYMRDNGYIYLMHASYPYSAPLSYLGVVNEVYNKQLIVNAFYGVSRQPTGWFCNNTDADYKTINDICEQNGGRAYPAPPSLYNNLYRLIPSNFMSSMVYFRRFDDCSNGQAVYFPVDSYTQSIQLNTYGYNNDIKIFRADGAEAPKELYYDVHNFASTTGWRITEIRKPCDPGWIELEDRYCMLIVHPTTLMSWNDAAAHCHSADASIVDMIYDVDNWINEVADGTTRDMWIGLHRKATDLSTFIWDAPPFMDPMKLRNETVHWDQDEPSTDATKLCVLRIAGGNWRLQNCNDLHSFLCQKHKYDAAFEPSYIEDDDLQNGKWWVTVKTGTPPLGSRFNSSSCFVEVRVQSSILVQALYALNMHADVPTFEPTLDTDQNRFITHIFGGDESTSLTHAFTYDFDTLEMISAATYQKRVGCEYSWVSQNWACMDGHPRFAVIHVGEDKNGVDFQRMTTGRCPETEANCTHGLLVEGLCACEDYYTGQTCDTPLCVNGGRVDPKTKTCQCPDGYGGRFCELAQCLPQVPQTFSIEEKTFGFVFEMTQPNKDALQRFASSFVALMQNISNVHPTWLTTFSAVCVNSTDHVGIISATDVNSFVIQLNQKIRKITDPGTNCGAPLFGGLLSLLHTSTFKSQGSVVFVITRAVANDEDANSNEFIKQLSVKKPQINYLIVDENETVCGKKVDDDSVMILSNYALLTGGNFFVLPPTNFIEFLMVYMPVLHSTTLLITPTLSNMTCLHAAWFAQVDYKMDYVYITAFTPRLYSAYITDPTGETTRSVEKLYAKGNTLLARVDTFRKPGIYTFEMLSRDICSVQIRGDSPINVWTGFTQPKDGDDGSHMDNVIPDPLAQVNNNINLHVSNLTQSGRLTYTELINPADGSVLISQLFRRQNCSYEYYSNSFVCPDQNFMIMVNGVDDYGQNFRREVGIARCSNTTTFDFLIESE